jgi:hypothetical protein
MNVQRASSTLRLSVKGKESDPKTGAAFPILAELDEVEVSNIGPQIP